MRHIYGFIILLFSFSFSVSAQPLAYFDYKVFCNELGNTYVETYFDFDAESVGYVRLPNQHLQAKVGVTLIVQQGEKIISYSKREVIGPECTDSTLVNFLDQNRLVVPPGNYQVEIELVDLNKTDKNVINFKQDLIINTPPPHTYASDIVFLGDVRPVIQPGPFTKGNQDLFPLVSNYLPVEISKLMFYAEIYNSDIQFADSLKQFLLIYKIANPKTGNAYRNFQRTLRQKTAPIIPLLATMDISGLPSGNYQLIIEIRNPKNELVHKSFRDFQRSNVNVEIADEELDQLLLDNSFVGTVNSSDTLTEYINCLRPIASEQEKRKIDHQKDLLTSIDAKKKFFYTFWSNRDALNPSEAWQHYRGQVAVANKTFGTRIKKGYETDRGRVYLQYGPPNTRTERPTEPSAYPYEIWHYYKINQYANKKFVFYNTDLSSNDYELLHSDVFGEIRNSNWQVLLSRRNTPTNNYDVKTPQSQYGGNANEFFNNPR